MNRREDLKHLRTGDVEIGFQPLKRRAAEAARWTCETCGATKAAGESKEPSRCSSKSGRHKWRSA